MKRIKLVVLVATVVLASCVSWVFAKSPFNDMPEGNYQVDLSHASINADEKDFDKLLATDKSWFNAGEFASIDFVSTGIELTGENTAIMTGDLNFLGVTLPVSLDVVFNGAMQRQPFTGKPTMGFSATTTIERSKWGMTKFVPNIGDTNEILTNKTHTKKA